MSEKGLDEKTQEFGEKYSGEREESVDNDRETISSNKPIKEMSIDRLSALPDCLIIHILSFLGVKKAAITSVLSKRWQFLWTELPRIELSVISRESEKIHDFVAGVHRILVTRRNYLEKFRVFFRYDECFAHDVDVWLELAVQNNVKEVALSLGRLGPSKDFYTLPQMMYSNSSLTKLSVRGCIMAPERTIEWLSLTSLEIREVELPQLVVVKILSGCPVLGHLDVARCWGFKCLEVNSRSLYGIMLFDHEDNEKEPFLEISAPYLRSLRISLYPKGRKLRLTKTPSIVRAEINFIGHSWDYNSMEVMSNTKELFENIQHVKELSLGSSCIKALSMMAVNEWQLPQSRRGCLTVNALTDDKHSIRGIIGLLESSPNLETLVIEGYDSRGAFATWDPPERGDLDCDLLHLKTVKFINFVNPNIGGDPMLTLARILLKRAKVLEKMVIVANVGNKNDLVKIGQTLLAYPRSSQKVVFVLPQLSHSCGANGSQFSTCNRCSEIM